MEDTVMISVETSDQANIRSLQRQNQQSQEDSDQYNFKQNKSTMEASKSTNQDQSQLQSNSNRVSKDNIVENVNQATLQQPKNAKNLRIEYNVNQILEKTTEEEDVACRANMINKYSQQSKKLVLRGRSIEFDKEHGKVYDERARSLNVKQKLKQIVEKSNTGMVNNDRSVEPIPRDKDTSRSNCDDSRGLSNRGAPHYGLQPALRKFEKGFTVLLSKNAQYRKDIKDQAQYGEIMYNQFNMTKINNDFNLNTTSLKDRNSGLSDVKTHGKGALQSKEQGPRSYSRNKTQSTLDDDMKENLKDLETFGFEKRLSKSKDNEPGGIKFRKFKKTNIIQNLNRNYQKEKNQMAEALREARKKMLDVDNLNDAECCIMEGMDTKASILPTHETVRSNSAQKSQGCKILTDAEDDKRIKELENKVNIMRSRLEYHAQDRMNKQKEYKNTENFKDQLVQLNSSDASAQLEQNTAVDQIKDNLEQRKLLKQKYEESMQCKDNQNSDQTMDDNQVLDEIQEKPEENKNDLNSTGFDPNGASFGSGQQNTDALDKSTSSCNDNIYGTEKYNGQDKSNIRKKKKNINFVQEMKKAELRRQDSEKIPEDNIEESKVYFDEKDDKTKQVEVNVPDKKAQKRSCLAQQINSKAISPNKTASVIGTKPSSKNQSKECSRKSSAKTVSASTRLNRQEKENKEQLAKEYKAGHAAVEKDIIQQQDLKRQCDDLISDVDHIKYDEDNGFEWDVNGPILQTELWENRREIQEQDAADLQKQMDPKALKNAVNNNNNRMDKILNEMYECIDCHLSVSLFQALKKKLKSDNQYWTPLKTTIDSLVGSLQKWHTVKSSHRLKYAVLNQIIDLPYFSYHSIGDMTNLFSNCKYETWVKGSTFKYNFNKIIIILKGTILFNYQPGEKIDMDEENLPESIRNFRKKQEDRIDDKAKNQNDLKAQDAQQKKEREKPVESDLFCDYRMELNDGDYITPEAQQLYKTNEIHVLVKEASEFFVIDNEKFLNTIEPKYFRHNFFSKLNFFLNHPLTKDLARTSIIHLAKQVKLNKYVFGDKVVKAFDKPDGAYFVFSGKCDVNFCSLKKIGCVFQTKARRKETVKNPYDKYKVSHFF